MSLTPGNLEKLGFNEKKSRLYLALLESGGTAAELAARAKLKRSTTYDYLNEFIREQLVSRSVRGSRRCFVAEPPSALSRMLDSRQRALDSLMPALRSLFLNRSSTLPNIRIYEGLEGARHIHEDLIKVPKSEYYYFGSMRSFALGLGQEYLSDFTRRRIKRGVWSNALRIRSRETNEPDSVGSEDNLRRVRYLPTAEGGDVSNITLT